MLHLLHRVRNATLWVMLATAVGLLLHHVMWGSCSNLGVIVVLLRHGGKLQQRRW